MTFFGHLLTNHLIEDDFRRFGNGKKSAETKSDGSELAKNPDDGFSTPQKFKFTNLVIMKIDTERV